MAVSYQNEIDDAVAALAAFVLSKGSAAAVTAPVMRAVDARGGLADGGKLVDREIAKDVSDEVVNGLCTRLSAKIAPGIEKKLGPAAGEALDEHLAKLRADMQTLLATMLP